ncbi:MAG: ABC transporter permease [Vicinamibacterales bacterium]
MSLRSWWKRRSLDEDDFKAEIRSHLAMAAQERIADGADPESAHYASLREFGNVALATEAARRVWTPWWVDALHDLVSDAVYALRSLARHPGFALTVVVVLTLGIALNAAVFTMLKSLALTPLAGVARSSQLVVVYGENNAGHALSISYPDYQYLRDHDTAFTGLAGTSLANVGLGRGRGARSMWAELVTGNYFQVLGVRAAYGRTLLPSDETAPGANPVVVLNHGLWQRDFGADPNVVGTTAEINGRSFTVVGVAAPTFHGTTVVYDVDVFLPITMGPELGFTFTSQQTTPTGILADRRATVFQPLGFLTRGTSLADAAARTAGLWAELARERPTGPGVERLRAVPFRKSPGGAPSILLPTLGVLAAMGLLVLLVACANIAGLVLVRGVARRGEIAVRLALGASRLRIVRLLVVENFVLALPGALLGVLLAREGVRWLAAYAERLAAPQRVFFNIEVDALVIGFAVAVAMASALVFGFVPALQSVRTRLVTVINEDASPRGASRTRLRSGLVVAQVAVSLLLLIGSGLVTRSLDAARHTHPGFETDHVASVELDVKQSGYDQTAGLAFYQRLLDAARADASVDSATLGAFGPLAFLETRSVPIAVDGYEPRRDEDLSLQYNVVAPDYFATLGVPLLSGRAFDARDDADTLPVVVVNGTLAERFWGDAAAAIGKRLRVDGGAWRTVVGVARDLKYVRIDEARRPYFYLPFRQSYRPAMTLYVHGVAPMDELVDHASALVAALDGAVPIRRARPMADALDGALMLFNLTASMLFVFGATGVALVALGTYGLMAFTVRQGTREIGIRLVLGAARSSVVSEYLGRGLRMGAVGAALGVVSALVATRFVRSALFGVSATDVGSYLRALALVLAIVVVATLVPSWRASRTAPLEALRHQ